MNDTLDVTVAVIAKECLPGKVKTRLVPPLSPVDAARLAQLSLSRTLATVRQLPVRRRLLVMDGTPIETDEEGFTVLPQVRGGLDERLAAICDIVSSPLLIVGMDTPQLASAHLAPLFRDWASAGGHDAWMGPAVDGGFWGLALRHPDGGMVRGVPMSTDRTGADQRARLVALGLSVGALPELRDMDYFSDAVQIAGDIPGSRFAAAVSALEPGARSTMLGKKGCE